MENYVKGKNVEHVRSREDIPISNLPSDCKWMKIKGGTKLRNVISETEKSLREDGAVIVSGFGPGIGKAITCTEIVKRGAKDAFQYNQICYRTIEEHWDPKTEDLDNLKVVRDIPEIFIVLSMQPLGDENQVHQKSLKEFLECEESCKVKRPSASRRGNKKSAKDLGMYRDNNQQKGNAQNEGKRRNRNEGSQRKKKPEEKESKKEISGAKENADGS